MGRCALIARLRACNPAGAQTRPAARGRMRPMARRPAGGRRAARDDTRFQITEGNTPETLDKGFGAWIDRVDFDAIKLKRTPTGSET